MSPELTICEKKLRMKVRFKFYNNEINYNKIVVFVFLSPVMSMPFQQVFYKLRFQANIIEHAKIQWFGPVPNFYNQSTVQKFSLVDSKLSQAKAHPQFKSFASRFDYWWARITRDRAIQSLIRLCIPLWKKSLIQSLT